MSPRPKRRKIIIAILVGLTLLALYAFFIEPSWIEVTHRAAAVPGGKLSAPLKIAHLSDLHTAGLGRRERALLAHLEREKPDVIVITGDTISGGDYEITRELISRLRAPLGVWLVRGNWENWQPLPRERDFYAHSGVNFLLNSGAQLRPDVWIAGLDDPASGSPDLQAALAGAPPSAVTIVLFHAPGFFDSMAGRADIALAGHTHGGQLRIPGVKPLWLPRGSGSYVAGWYQKSGSAMYVSRGIGTSILPARLFCRPELAIITLSN